MNLEETLKKKSLQWIHRDRRERHDEGDIDEKFRVVQILKKYFNLDALSDEILFFDRITGKPVDLDQSQFESKDEIFHRYIVHKPDLLIKNHKPMIIVEIDGPVHWENTKAMKKTNQRNADYEASGLQMLWLTKDDALVKQQSDLVLNISARLGLRLKI